MKQLKRWLSLVLLLALTAAAPPANTAFAADITEAYIQMDESGGDSHIKAAHKYEDVEPIVAEYEGRSSWEMNNKNGDGRLYIMFDLGRGFMYNLMDCSNVEVEIEYFDSGISSFNLEYDKGDGAVGKTDLVYLRDTGRWMSETFLLEAPRFSDGLSGFDMRLCLAGSIDATVENYALIGGIRVKYAASRAPVEIAVASDAVGHIFYNDEPMLFDVTLQNRDFADCTFQLKSSLIASDGSVAWEQVQDETLGRNATLTLEIQPESMRFDTYILKLEALDDAGTVYSSIQRQTARVNAVEDGYNNPRLGVNMHGDRRPDTVPDQTNLVDKIGLGIIRGGPPWHLYEERPKNYNLDTWYKEQLIQCKELGIDILYPVAYANIGVYGDLSGPPANDETLKAYCDYAEYFASETKDYIKYFEVWNEYNIPAFNGLGLPPSQYNKMTMAVSESIWKSAPDAEIIAFSPAGVAAPWIEQVIEANPAIMDSFTHVGIHPYPWSERFEGSGKEQEFLTLLDLIKKYDPEGRKYWATEMGWTSASAWNLDEDDQANWSVSLILYNEWKQYLDRIVFYELVNSGLSQSAQEDAFGFVRSHDDTENPFAAKPVYLAVANAIKQLQDMECVGGLELDNSDTYGVIFQNPESGEYLTALWGKEGKKAAVQFGADAIDVIDIYGNISKHVGVDGVHTLFLTDAPIYIRSNVLPAAAEPFIEPESESISSPPNSDVVFTIESSYGKPLEWSVKAGEGNMVESAEITGSQDGATVNLRLSGRTGDKGTVIIEATDNGVPCYQAEFPILLLESIHLDFNTAPYSYANSKRWKTTVSVTNNKETPIEGSFVINGPESLRQVLPTIDLPVIEPGKTHTFSFNLPELKSRESQALEGRVVLDDGEWTDFSYNMFFNGIIYASEKPVIDGVMEEGEWSMTSPVYINTEEQAANLPTWGGVNDLSATASLMWDEEALYLGVTVEDNVHKNDRQPSDSWNGDSLQFGFAYYRPSLTSQAGDFEELTLALNGNGQPMAYRFGTETDKLIGDVLNDIEYKATRSGTKTYYEAKFPWSFLLPVTEEPVMEAGDEFLFTILVNDDDGAGRAGWIEYGGGIGGTKDKNQFMGGSLFAKIE